jgi:hypothetical protein
MAVPTNRVSGQVIASADLNTIATALNETAAMVADISTLVSALIARLDALETNGPAQTTTVTATTDSATITVNWTAAIGATGYTVALDRIDGGASGVTPVGKSSTQLSHTFTGLTNGVAYRATVTIAPSGAQRTVQATPTAAAGGTGITLTKTVGDGQVTVNWTAAANATGYDVGRDGTDTNGSGAWHTDPPDPSTARSRTFLSLVNGTSYTFTVTPLPNGVPVSITGTPVAGTTTTPTAPPSGAGTVWLSGAGDDNANNTAGGGFGSWRGESATFARAWMDASADAMIGMDMMMAYKTSNWNGVLDLAIGGPGRVGSWALAASGGSFGVTIGGVQTTKTMDDIWRMQCQKINANWWPNCKGIHLSMGHELSGNWYPWSVNSGNVTQFKAGWKRWYNIVQEELVSKGRNVKVVLCYNFDTVADISVQQIDPGAAYYNVLGVDFYNMWWGGSAASGLNTQATWDANLDAMDGASPKGIRSWFNYAASIGKPLSIPEWGTSPQATVEAPLFVTNMRNFFASKAPVDAYNPAAGKIAGESYFNTWDQCRLYPTTSLPTTASTYRNLVWGK